MEWNVMERNGVECYAVECNRMLWNGMECDEIEGTRMVWNGMEHYLMEWNVGERTFWLAFWTSQP